MIEPGTLDANAIIPGPPSAVYVFWNMDSPENILLNALPMPPVPVAIFIFGVIHDIAPFWHITLSPPSR